MAFTSGTPGAGPISATDLNNEFGRGYSLNNYYGVAYQVPTSGTISYNDLRGKYRYWGGRSFTTNNGVPFRTWSDAVEYNGNGYGWSYRDVRNRANNPGVQGEASNNFAIYHFGNDGGIYVEKAFWYYYWGWPRAGWRFCMLTWRRNGGYYNQHYNTISQPYRSYIRVGINNQYFANLQMGYNPTGGGFYRQTTGDTSQRRSVTWLWPTTMTLSGSTDFQYVTQYG